MTLEDLSPKELQYLLDKYNGECGGAPGSRGCLMAWADYWKKALTHFANK